MKLPSLATSPHPLFLGTTNRLTVDSPRRGENIAPQYALGQGKAQFLLQQFVRQPRIGLSLPVAGRHERQIHGAGDKTGIRE